MPYHRSAESAQAPSLVIPAKVPRFPIGACSYWMLAFASMTLLAVLRGGVRRHDADLAGDLDKRGPGGLRQRNAAL
jgi:hypothetical protein